MTRGPSESLVVALDAPVGFIRANFWTLLRVVGPVALLSQLLSLPGQFLQAWLSSDSLDGLDGLTGVLAIVGASLGSTCLFFAFYPVSILAIYAVATDLSAGRRPTVWRTLSAAANPMRWLTASVIFVLAAVASVALLVPGLVLSAFLSFAFPILFEEDARGVEALRRSLYIARYGGGPWWRAPWAKVAVAGVAWWLLASALGTVAALPVWIDTAWRAWGSITSGNSTLLTELQSTSVWAVAAGSVLGALARVVTDTYGCMTCALVYRDVRARMSGEEIEARVAALEGRR